MAEEHGGRLQFVELVQPSANSVFRLLVADGFSVPLVRNSLRALGCESEGSYIPNLFSFEIPGSIDIGPIEVFITEGAEQGRWEYEEGVMRHPTTT